MMKKLIIFFLATSLLANTSTNALEIDPTHIAILSVGLIMTGGGVYWLVKNPNDNRESCTKRTCRTICALALTAGGIRLILKSESLQQADYNFDSLLGFLRSKIESLKSNFFGSKDDLLAETNRNFRDLRNYLARKQ
ncbi:MAG: hypothetical protein Q8Q25_00555 [bacterium]|nr:hypothetical protein [bacterium]